MYARTRPNPRQVAPSGWSAFAALYCVGVLLWNLLRLTPLSRWGLFQLLDIFGVWMYLPLPFALVLGIVRRNTAGLVWLLGPVLAFGIEYGVVFWPNESPPAGAPLRVLTSNLLTTNDDASDVAAAILDEAPDVVAVQELGGEMESGLARRLRERYPYQVLYGGDSAPGQGIFSRFPIIGTRPPEMYPGGCFCQEAIIGFDNRRVRLVNVHLENPEYSFRRFKRLPVPRGFGTERQDQALRIIQQRLAWNTEPLLLVGDFNLSDRQPSYREVSRRLYDTHREVGWGFGFSFPSNERRIGLPIPPLIRIDYVFHDGAWSARSLRDAAMPGSDHRFVVADLVLHETRSGAN